MEARPLNSPAANRAVAGAYITFRAGDTHFALAVSYVRYITTFQALKRRSSPSKEGITHTVFDFGGETLALYSFNEIIHTGAHTEEIESLIPLLEARREDHVLWLAALEHSIKTGEPFTKAGDPHECAFGIWYDSYQAQDAELRRVLARFREPHKRLHSLAEELLTLARNKNNVPVAERRLAQERETTFKQLLGLFDEAQGRLEELNKPVVIVLDDGKNKFGLQVESIGDIKQFESTAWLPDKNGDERNCFDGYFQTADKSLFLNIIPHRVRAIA